MKNILSLLCAVIALANISTANAALIVDTGPGAGNNSGGLSLYSGQWLAAEFSTSQAYTITNIEGWIGGGPGTATLAIYDDGGSIPGTELFSTGFSVDSTLDDWYGASGLSWFLDAGTYWAAFEVRAGDTLGGWMEVPVSSPLINEAFTSSSTWISNTSLDIGVRINAETTATVPTPPTIALFGLGLVGFGFSRRKAKA